MFGVAAPAGDLGESSREIGYSIAAGILIDTFLVRTLLVPSMVVLSGRFNWWPSHLWRRPLVTAGEPVIEREKVPVKELVGVGRKRLR